MIGPIIDSLGYQCALVVDDSGRVIQGLVLNNGRWIKAVKTGIYPNSVRFIRTYQSEPTPLPNSTAYPRENFELIFTGLTDKYFTIVYREYTDEGLARTPFFQELKYEKNESLIRFKRFLMEIIAISNQSITYKVLSDNQ